MDYCLKTSIAVFIFVQVLVRTSCQYDKGSTIYMDEIKTIFKTIFPTYNKNVPPRKDYPAPITVDLTANVVHVSDLDVNSQVLLSTVDVTVMWKDTRLAWNSQTVKEITTDKMLVWRPKITVVNAVGQSVEVHAPDLVLKGTGDIKWIRRLQLQTSCPFDKSNKTVTCDIVFGAGVHLQYKLTDFGNVTDDTCSTSVTSTNMWDVSMTGSKLEDQQVGNVTIEAEPEITCTVQLTKMPGYSSVYQPASNDDGTSEGQNLGTSLEISGLFFLVSFILQCILAQL